MRIDTTTVIDHPLAVVAAWHERPGALVRLTPPGLASLEDPAQGGLEEGRHVRTALGPALLPGTVRPMWELRHTQHSRSPELVSFTDEQVSGPFRSWRHRHELIAVDDRTRLVDRIDLELPTALSPLSGTVRTQLERTLAYRSRQLRDDLAFHACHRDAPRLTVAVAGASGLIGTQLCALLTTGGHTVLRMVRGREAGPGEISWDPAQGRLDPGDLQGVDAVVNLAGRSIGTRMSPQAKREILASRVDCATLIARTLAAMEEGPRILIQASAIGHYGPQRPGELLTEDDPGGDGFLAGVTRAWQDAARPADDAGVRVVHMRTGIVLSDAGGALLPQLPLFLAGAGGRLSAPDSVLSWISLDDLVRAYAHALLTPTLEGPVNAVAPSPATSAEFARTLGAVLHRPSLLPVPAAGPRLLLGREGADELVLADQRVSDQRLRASGFEPAHPGLEAALRHVLRR